jgi:hypothetical protein
MNALLFLFIFKGFLPVPIFPFFYTNNAHKDNYRQQNRCVSPKNIYALAGFEPGPSLPEADAMSTAPRHR